jgi:protein-S-isoprenylcysteine O-methyltransferase Ste14
MLVLYIALLGVQGFVAGVVILGSWLGRNRSRENAEQSSRIMHFLFFACLAMPPAISCFYPGITHLDELVGLHSLPMQPVFLALGVVLLIPGLYLAAVSNRLLVISGSGANAFHLTKHVVANDIYRRTRNPMSLGYYLCSLSIGLISGSTFATLGVLLGYIPAHIFFLRSFEELELELRFGEPYKEYRRKVPFLIPRLSAD